MKEIIYKAISRTGIRIMTKIFPEYFAKEPLKPTDRYIEYTFAIKNLPKPPAKTLDVGCSGSFFPLLLASFGYETCAIDIRTYPVLNKMEFENFTFVKGDIRDYSFADDEFNVITAISTIEHIGISGRYGAKEDPEGDLEAIEAMRRALKPEGTLILTIPFGKAKIIKTYMRVYDEARLEKITRNFEIEKKECYMQDGSDNWIRCSEKDTLSLDVKTDRYPLCLLKLKNNKDAI